MLLAIDIGNTNITLGVFEDRELLGKFRMTTMMSRTSDEYGITLRELLRNQNMNPDEIDAVIVASVVPDIMHSFSSAIIKYFGHKPVIVSAGIKTGIRVATENPRQTGPDRIVDAVAAYKLYGGPIIVVDFGTATTFDLVEPDGTFGIGVTAPGIRTSARALWGGAAMLPEIEIRKPDTILARETISSMQAGLVYGYIGQTEYLVLPCTAIADAPAASMTFAISTAFSDCSSKPLRIFTVTGFRIAFTVSATILYTSFGFFMSADPSPFFTTFGTGQPMLISNI